MNLSHTHTHTHTHTHRESKLKKNIFYVDRHCHPHSIAVVQTRARHLGVEVRVEDFQQFSLTDKDVCGVLVQYPNTDGQIEDFSQMIETAHANKVR